jgi:hypothetical protein
MNRFDNGVPPPSGVNVVKGAVHIIATRGFVDYAINSPTAGKFLWWVKMTKIPDETFFSSLNHSPQLKVPGSYLGELQCVLRSLKITEKLLHVRIKFNRA